jgi:hypothetical protein
MGPHFAYTSPNLCSSAGECLRTYTVKAKRSIYESLRVGAHSGEPTPQHF